MVQQNQLICIYNQFKPLTSESWTSQNRLSTIGFYPDVANVAGCDNSNTANSIFAPASTTANNSENNLGFIKEQIYFRR